MPAWLVLAIPCFAQQCDESIGLRNRRAAAGPAVVKPDFDIAEFYFPRNSERRGVPFCLFALGAMAVLLLLVIQVTLHSRDLN